MKLSPLALELTIVMSVWICLGVWQRHRAALGRHAFIGLCLAAIAWCAGELLFLRGACSEVAADRLKYIGVLSLPPLWLGAAASAARMQFARRIPWFPVLLLAPQAILFALMFSARWHGLFLTTVTDGPDRYGPLWWVSTAYGYALILTGSAIFVWHALRWRHAAHWKRSLAVGLSPLVPLAANAAFTAAGRTWFYDPTPLAFGVVLLTVRSAFSNGGLLRTLPYSQHELIQRLPVGVVVMDPRRTVVAVNSAAEVQMGIAEQRAIGRSLESLLSRARDGLRIRMRPVISQGREAGFVALLEAGASRAKPEGAPLS
jgi:PAS domain-containing protein